MFTEVIPANLPTISRVNPESLIQKFLPSGVESVTKGFVSGWASVPVIDNSRDLILGTAIDTTVYESNPIVLWCHNRNQLPIGRSELAGGGFGLKVKDFQANGLPGLWHSTRFNLDDEFAAKVYGCYESGFLKGWSVGFIPKARMTQIPHELTKRLNDSAPGRFYPAVRLYEYSAVPIPDNQLALSDVRFKSLGVPDWYLPLVAKWTEPQSTFAARYHSPIPTAMEDLPAFTGELSIAKQFPVDTPPSRTTVEDRTMSAPATEELVPLTPAEGVALNPPAYIEKMQACIECIPELVEKAVQAAVADAVEVIAKCQRDATAALDESIHKAAELQLQTMGKLAGAK